MRTRHRLLAVLLAGGLALGVAAPALAQDVVVDEAPADPATDARVRDLKDRCLDAIDRRLVDLEAAEVRVADSDVVTDAHKVALIAIIDDTQAGLRDLRARIVDSTDPRETLRLCRTIAPDYRVYLVVLPQVHLVSVADHGDRAVTRGAEALDELAQAITRAEEAGLDVDDAWEYHDQAVRHLDAASTAIDGTAEAVLGVTPESFNAGPGREVLAAARADLRTARDELRQAWDAAHAAVEELRDAIGGAGGDSGDSGDGGAGDAA